MTALRARFGMAWLGAAAILVSTAVMAFWYLGYAHDFFADRGTYDVTAEFAAVPQLQEGDPVRVDGREEGRVVSIADVGGGRGARVRFTLHHDAGPIYHDARVQLRWKSLLGGAFYLEVDRGTPRAGGLDGATIPRTQTVGQVELDDVTAIFRGRVIHGLDTMPGQLSRALRDPRTLTGLLSTAADVSPALDRGLGAVRGSTPDSDLQYLISGTAHTVAALDAPRDDLRRLVAGAGSFATTLGGRGRELRATIAQGPALTERLQTTLARLDGTLTKVDRLAGALDRAAPRVAPTLAALRPTLAKTATLLGHARPLVRDLRPAASSLLALARTGLPLLDGLQPSFDRLDDVILPGLSKKDPGTGKPTSVMIGGTAAGFGGAASQQDENGHFIRFPASGGNNNVYLPCKTSLVDPTAGAIAVCDSLQKALTTYLQYVPPALGSGKEGR